MEAHYEMRSMEGEAKITLYIHPDEIELLKTGKDSIVSMQQFLNIHNCHSSNNEAVLSVFNLLDVIERACND